MLRVIIFDVEHGFSTFVKSPTGHTLMIDCGKTSDFSPVNYILKNELGGTVIRNGHRLTKLIVTHPHDDHIEDIANLTSKLAPSILQRQRYDWDAIKEPDAQSGEYENLDHYAVWQTKYSEPVNDEPDWGMQIETFFLTPKDSLALDDTKYVNNSSIVTVVSFEGTEFTEKFLFGADVEQAGWEALLKRASFKSAVSGTDFFIAPHHGHTSGFSTALYDAIGKPILNLVSVHSRDENVDSRYSSKDYASGVEFDGERRYMLSTRNDGSIFLDVGSDGKFSVYTQNLPANIVKKSW